MIFKDNFIQKLNIILLKKYYFSKKINLDKLFKYYFNYNFLKIFFYNAKNFKSFNSLNKNTFKANYNKLHYKLNKPQLYIDYRYNSYFYNYNFYKIINYISYNYNFFYNTLYFNFFQKNNFSLNIISNKMFFKNNIFSKFLLDKNLENIKKKFPPFFLNFKMYNSLHILGNNFFTNFNLKYFNKQIYLNNYPVFLNTLFLNFFKKRFKLNREIDFFVFFSNSVLSFFEFYFKKKIFFKIFNNFSKNNNSKHFKHILNDYRNFKPLYFKNFFVLDFIELIWYSFLLKDLKFISDWITKFMESLNFKNHKKFLMFFNNFLLKNSSVFIDVLKIKGFYFDIRGKVGVTGSSKKRHLCFKFGSVNKSQKNCKLNFNQNLVRTYSGVMGLTYIISY